MNIGIAPFRLGVLVGSIPKLAALVTRLFLIQVIKYHQLVVAVRLLRRAHGVIQGKPPVTTKQTLPLLCLFLLLGEDAA